MADESPTIGTLGGYTNNQMNKEGIKKLLNKLDGVSEDVEDITTKLATKQDKLTAGTGISISEENVISASVAPGEYTPVTTQEELESLFTYVTNAEKPGYPDHYVTNKDIKMVAKINGEWLGSAGVQLYEIELAKGTRGNGTPVKIMASSTRGFAMVGLRFYKKGVANIFTIQGGDYIGQLFDDGSGDYYVENRSIVNDLTLVSEFTSGFNQVIVYYRGE